MRPITDASVSSPVKGATHDPAALYRVELDHGLTLGNATYRVAHLRQLAAGDIFDAQEAAERVVETRTGLAMVLSPSAFGRELLGRQVARLEDEDGQVHSGPLSRAELARLNPADLERLQARADSLDAVAALSLAEGADARGRADQGGGGADRGHGFPGAAGGPDVPGGLRHAAAPAFPHAAGAASENGGEGR